MPTSRMVRAISLGVFWRLAPSTMAIMRSRKVSPGLTVTRITSQSDSTRVPPVTALQSPPASRITGADSPVMADSSTEATPSITSPSPGIDLAGLDQHQVALAQLFRIDDVGGGVMARLRELLGQDRPAHALQRRRLGLAPAFRHGLGEVGKQHREPEPERDGQDEPGRASPWPSQGLDEQAGGEQAAQPDHEHHRVLHLVAGRAGASPHPRRPPLSRAAS